MIQIQDKFAMEQEDVKFEIDDKFEIDEKLEIFKSELIGEYGLFDYMFNEYLKREYGITAEQFKEIIKNIGAEYFI